MRRLERPWSVAVTVEGLNLGRFVRRAGEQGIRLTALRRTSFKALSALVNEAELPALQDIAMSGGWSLHTGERRGAGRAATWLQGRWVLAAAICTGVIALAMCSQLVWKVEIMGGGPYQADIRAAVEELGIHPPLLRRQVDLGALRDALEWRYPRLAWVECGWRGMALVVRPVEGALPDDNVQDAVMDVVAAQDGVIQRIVTVAGTPVVQPGDVVRAGELLIRGEERTSQGAVKPVAARGSVSARIWRGASVRMSAVERVTRYTGNENTVWTISTPWFDLWPVEECHYAQYDTSVSETALCGMFFPVKLRRETRMEAMITTSVREQQELEAEAYAAAVHKLREKLSAEESLIDIWGNCSMIDAENIVFVAVGEMIVEIGRRVPASGMAAPAGDTPE